MRYLTFVSYLLQVYTTEEALVIVMECASLGSLEERLATAGTLSESVSKKLFRQLVDGMLYCHEQVRFFAGRSVGSFR